MSTNVFDFLTTVCFNGVLHGHFLGIKMQQLTLIGMASSRAFYIKVHSLAGCQINPIDVNFHLQKSLEVFDKKSAD
jgi:hypothetical protein